MMDAVYVLGKGSTWLDNELRYSLRSLERYVSGIRQVWVIGEHPSWLTGVAHVPFKDSNLCKERNIMDKIMRACVEQDLSDNFLFVNDDHFAIKHQAAEQLPNWHGRELSFYEGDSKPYRIAVGNTARALRARGYGRLNFDIHYPIIYNKNEFPRVMRMYDWESECYVVKSLYGNTMQLPGTRIEDIKISSPSTNQYLLRALLHRPWFSIGPKAINHNLKALLEALFPQRSRWEK